MTDSILKRGISVTIYRVGLWCYIFSISFLLIGAVQLNYMLLQYAGLIFLFGLIFQLSSILIQQSIKRPDEYAASVHQNMIERFFIQAEKTTALTNTLPELINRTSFTKPDKIQPLKSAYQSMTTVILFVSLASVLYWSIGQNAVVIFSLGLLGLYITDRLFGFRSSFYFRDKSEHILDKDELETTHIELTVDVFTEKLGLDERPKVIYSDTDALIAGASNPVFHTSELYVSKELLLKETHIQTGIIAHEMGHIKVDEDNLYTHKTIQMMIPLVLILFTVVPVSIWSIFGVTIILSGVVSLVAVARHYEEFEADSIATILTDVEFVILSLIEFTNHNPFITALPYGFEKLTRIVSTHPPISIRIQRLLEASG